MRPQRPPPRQRRRGVLRARDQAVLASELAGRITEMPYAEGQAFKKGEVLVRFDCAAYQAQLMPPTPPPVPPARN